MSTAATIAPSAHRLGIDVHMYAGPAPVVSPQWGLGAWRVQFVRLDANQTYSLDQSAGAVYIKVVTGRLNSLDRGAYAPAKVVRNTRVSAESVQAGPAGALFTIFTATADLANSVKAMSQLTYTGPMAERLGWETFEQRYHDFTPFFDGLDAYLSPGFHLLDANGEEITYLFVWTAGKGVDLSTHNHGRAPSATSPAFAEVHWVLHNGTGAGGMYETPEPGSPVRERWALQQGDEHGPFFMFDPATGAAKLRDNGAVEYPWHGWQAGPDDGAGQSYDVVAAFEITAPYADVLA